MELLKLPRDIWDIIVFKHNLSAHDFMNLADASALFQSLVKEYVCVVSNDINHPSNALAVKFIGFNMSGLNVSKLPIRFDFDDCMLDSTISSSVMTVFNFVLNKDFDNDLEFYLKSFGMKCNQHEKYYQFNFFSLQEKSTTNKDFKVLDTIKEWINCKHCTVFQEKYFLRYQVYELDRSIFEVGNNVVSDDNDNSQIVKHKKPEQDYIWQSIQKLFIQRQTIVLDNHSCSFDLINLRLQNLTSLTLSSSNFHSDSSKSNLDSSEYIPPFCLEDFEFPNLISFTTLHGARIQSIINCKFNKLQFFDVHCSFWFIMRRVQLKTVQDLKLSSSSRYSSNYPKPKNIDPPNELAGCELQLSKKYSISSNLVKKNNVLFGSDRPQHFTYFELLNLDFGLPRDVHASLSSMDLFSMVCVLSSSPIEMFRLIKIDYGEEYLGRIGLVNVVDELDRGLFFFKNTDDCFKASMITRNGCLCKYIGSERESADSTYDEEDYSTPFKYAANALDLYFNPEGWSSRFLFVPHGQISVNSGETYEKKNLAVVQVSAKSDAKLRVGRTLVIYYQLESSASNS